MSTLPDQATIAATAAKILLEIKALHFNAEDALHLHVRLGEPGLHRLPPHRVLPARTARR